MRSALIVWMVIFGLVAAFVGVIGLIQWSGLPAPTKLYYLISTLAGVALLALGAWAISLRAARRAVAVGGLFAALILGVNQGLGVWLQTIPCHTPS